jgi:hypothetical protein
VAGRKWEKENRAMALGYVELKRCSFVAFACVQDEANSSRFELSRYTGP